MLVSRTNRRAFIAGLGGAAAWPMVARGQQPERIRRIGVLAPGASDAPVQRVRVEAFVQALQPLGWSVGRNLQLDARWATSDADLRKQATELVAAAPDVILASTSHLERKFVTLYDSSNLCRGERLWRMQV